MILITGFNQHQAPLGELTAPLMEDYARRHKLGFRCVRFEATGKEAYWQKIIETLRAFDEGFDRVFWLDADQAITNPNVKPLERFSDFYGVNAYFTASRDWGNDAEEMDFSMCGYVAEVEGRHLFEWVNERHDEYINGDFPEQTPMRKICGEHKVWIEERRIFNAVPDEVSPGNVVEPWQPGDFACHITMVPIAERVELFHKIMGRLKR